MLGEVDGGVIEQVVSSVASRRSGHLRAGVAGLVEGGGEVGGDATTEETLSMDDALLSVLEETLEKAELLTEAAGFADPAAWASGALHDQLEAGQLLRVTSEAQLIDPEFFASSVSRLVGALETMAVFIAGPEVMTKSAKDRERASRAQVKALMGGMPPEVVRQGGGKLTRRQDTRVHAASSIAAPMKPQQVEYAEMAAQDDAREREMRTLFNLVRAPDAGRSDVDALLELRGRSVPKTLRGARIDFELKSATGGRPNISTARARPQSFNSDRRSTLEGSVSARITVCTSPADRFDPTSSSPGLAWPSSSTAASGIAVQCTRRTPARTPPSGRRSSDVTSSVTEPTTLRFRQPMVGRPRLGARRPADGGRTDRSDTPSGT